MTLKPVVSIITGTYINHRVLMSRCILSVANQTYNNFEHIIISDGPDEMLKNKIKHLKNPRLRFFQLGRNWRSFTKGKSFGAMPRLAGTLLAQGKYIAYLDDDNEYQPQHIEKLVCLIEEKRADFVFSKMYMTKSRKMIGSVNPKFGDIDSSMILHHSKLLNVANWRPAGYADDWDLVKRWLQKKAVYAFYDNITVIYHGSLGNNFLKHRKIYKKFIE